MSFKKNVKMSCYIEGYGLCKNTKEISCDPDKCGDDSFFVYSDDVKCCIGICDGVGGWRHLKKTHEIDIDVNPSLISKQMCKNAKLFCEIESKPINIMNMAYNKIIENNEIEAGTTTCTIITIDLENLILESAHIGDSGYIIIRDEDYLVHCVTESFNGPPNQFGVIPDSLKHLDIVNRPINTAEINKFQLQHNDIIVLGSDGLWDNFIHPIIITTDLVCNSSITRLAKNLVEKAFEINKKKDDITTVICKI